MAVTIQSKRCSHCKEIKHLSEFNKDRSRKDGYQNQCKRCCQNYYQSHRVERLQYGQVHRAERLQYRKEYCSTLQGRLRNIWHSMLHRCNNPKFKLYKYYGGRGIQVKFACFDDFFNYVVKELKADPRGLTIDRINNNGHYETGNIRFVTHRENCQNRRKKEQIKSSQCNLFQIY